MNEVKLQYEIDKELNSAGAKNTTSVMALVNRDNISFDSEKGLRGLKEQLDDLKEMKVIYSYMITMIKAAQKMPIVKAIQTVI